MRFVCGRDPARRPRPICQPRPSRCRGRARRRRSCGVPEPPPAKKRSEARERLLAAASRLFYAGGITSVGIERIIKEGQVTLATFYRHFPSKVDLVVAYLNGAHDHICRARQGAGRNAGARPCPRCR
jgi:AcrR family transcriptional regulator